MHSRIEDFFGSVLIGCERDLLGCVCELTLRREDGRILTVIPISNNAGDEWLGFSQKEDS